LIFASTGAAAQSVTVTDPGAVLSTITVSPTPAGIATAAYNGTSGLLTVNPQTTGNTSVKINDGYNTIGLAVNVQTAATPGPLAVATSSVAFANPSATPTTIAVTDPNYGGVFTTTGTNTAIATVQGLTTGVTITPVSPGSTSVTIGDTYNTLSPVTISVGTPGPLALATPSVSFNAPGALATAIAITDPGAKTSAFTVAVSPNSIATGTIVNSTVVINPEAAGTATATIGDGTGNTVPLAVSVSTPVAIYTNPAPAGTAIPTGPLAYPTAPVTIPTPGTFTLMVQMKCNPGTAQTTNGSNLFGSNELQLKSGRCGGAGVTNPTNMGTSTQAYLSDINQYAEPTNELAATPTQYVIFATDDGATLSWWQCTYPTVACTQSTGAVTGPATWANASAYIGYSSALTRPFAGDLWNVQLFGSVIANTPSEMAAAVASYATADPYPSPLPTPVWTDAAPNNTATPSGSLTWPDPNGASTLSSVPTPSTFTWLAQINCMPTSTQTTNGSTIMSIGTSGGGYVTMKAGQCNGATQGTGSAIAQGFVSSSATGSSAITALTANQPYVIALTNDSLGNLTYYSCPITATIACTAAPYAGPTTAPVFGAGNGYAGAEYNGTTRIFSGDIWNLQIYNSALVTSCNGSQTTATSCPAMAQVATALATSDPFAGNPQYPAAGWVPYPAAGTTQGLQVPLHSVFGTDRQMAGLDSPGCGVTSSGYAAIQQSAATSGTTYQTCLHIHNSGVTSTLANHFNTCTSGQCLGQISAWVGTGTELAAQWNTGNHQNYGSPHGDNSVSFYVATSANASSTMGMLNGGCPVSGGRNDFSLTYPVLSTSANAIHYNPLWIPQFGVDSHLEIRDTENTTNPVEWVTILSGVPPSTGVSNPVSTNGGFWPNVAYPYQSNTISSSGFNCVSTYNGTQYSGPGTVSNINYNTSTGLDINGSAGRMSFAYALRPEEVLAAAGQYSQYVTHAIPYYNLCDTNSGGGPSATRYVNYPAYGYGDQVPAPTYTPLTQNNNCNYFTNGDSDFPDYGGLLYSTAAPDNTKTPCNYLEWFMWETAYLYGWYKNDVSEIGYGQYLSFVAINDSVDTYATTTTAQWQTASAWYALSKKLGDTITLGTYGQQYLPTARNPSCGLSLGTNLRYGIPPVNKTNAVPAYVGTTRP
jgi:hypothetical protein